MRTCVINMFNVRFSVCQEKDNENDSGKGAWEVDGISVACTPRSAHVEDGKISVQPPSMSLALHTEARLLNVWIFPRKSFAPSTG